MVATIAALGQLLSYQSSENDMLLVDDGRLKTVIDTLRSKKRYL